MFVHVNFNCFCREKVQIPYNKPCIILEGSGRNVTTVAHANHYKTTTSATFISSPPNVVVSGITFEVNIRTLIG